MSWDSFKWGRASARNWGVGPCPARCVWQGSGFAADQTNAMLAVVRRERDDESLVSAASARKLALSVARHLPTETASLGFGGSPVGGGDKTPVLHFFGISVWGGITTLRPLCLCRNNPARGLFQQKKRLSQSGCSAPTNALFPLAHSAFSAFLHGGGITTLGVRFMLLKRWTPAGHGGVFAVFMPPQCSPCAGRISPRRVHTPPQPLTAHTAAHTPKHGGFSGRWSMVDVSGSGIIDTIDPFQADQTVAVALAEGHRNAVSP